MQALLSYVQALEESSRVEVQYALANKITCALTSEVCVCVCVCVCVSVSVCLSVTVCLCVCVCLR
jgi:hypothetical protein